MTHHKWLYQQNKYFRGFLDHENIHLDTKIIFLAALESRIRLLLYFGGHLGGHLFCLRTCLRNILWKKSSTYLTRHWPDFPPDYKHDFTTRDYENSNRPLEISWKTIQGSSTSYLFSDQSEHFNLTTPLNTRWCLSYKRDISLILRGDVIIISYTTRPCVN